MGFHSLTTSTEIVNLALQRIGEKTVEDITDSNERARNVNLIYQFELDNLTATYKWRFARRKTTIVLDTSSITVFADHSGTVAGTVLATDTGHPYLSGETVNIFDGSVGSYDGNRVITKVDANSYFFTAAFVSTETATSRWTSNEWEFRFSLPSDLTDIIQVEGNLTGAFIPIWASGQTNRTPYAVEGAFIVINAVNDNLIITYDQKISDVSLMPTYFIRLLYMRMGLELVLRREGSRTLIDRFRDELTSVDREAMRLDRGNDFVDDQGIFSVLGVNPPSRAESNLFPAAFSRGLDV